MNTIRSYDIIIIGAGAAGLALAYHISQSPKLSHSKVLLLDKEHKSGDDRTWCFWEDDAGLYDDILTARWSRLQFHSDSFAKVLEIKPYTYKMLRSSDYYNFMLTAINKSDNIEFEVDEVVKVDPKLGQVTTENNHYKGEYIFSSQVPVNDAKSSHLYTAQHFGGWFIEMENEVFDDQSATFMDFRIEQIDDTRFMYVLPISKKKALVEVAIFSNDLLTHEGYDQIMIDYLEQYFSNNKYSIEETEYGVIPMTNYPFWNHNQGKLFHIGTAGGAVKPSSGYAFSRMQRHAREIVGCLEKEVSPAASYHIFKGRHLLYDAIMLDVLINQNIKGADVFSDLFQNSTAVNVLKFLDGDTSFLEDINIFRAPPKWPFIKGMVKVLRSK